MDRIVRMHIELEGLLREMDPNECQHIRFAKDELATLIPADALNAIGMLDPCWRGDEAAAADLLAAFDRDKSESRDDRNK